MQAQDTTAPAPVQMERKDSLVGEYQPDPTTPTKPEQQDSVDKPKTSAMIDQPAEVETPAPIREADSPLGIKEEIMILTDASIKQEEVVVEPRERNPEKSHLFTYQYHAK